MSNHFAESFGSVSQSPGSLKAGEDRAQVAATSKARELQQQTFDSEQKKYQLGASTTYVVIQTQRDLLVAQGNELRALANLVVPYPTRGEAGKRAAGGFFTPTLFAPRTRRLVRLLARLG